MTIPPPLPAPYLEGIKPLPVKLLKHLDGRRVLPKEKERTFLWGVKAKARRIRRAREAWEKENSVVIESEPGTLPSQIKIDGMTESDD